MEEMIRLMLCLLNDKKMMSLWWNPIIENLLKRMVFWSLIAAQYKQQQMADTIE